ncbi:MAG: T9SS type A sorting domain-containing protein [Flavobacteriales bacterium]|nr:T9SS type A sorting domain-containing protein [Flavobacteriales bacterium]
MKRILTLFLLAFFTHLATAQVAQGGEPYMWETIEKRDLGICGKTFTALDVEKLLQEDAETNGDKSQAYRFGIEHEVDWNNENSGTFKYLENGDRIWYLPIRCVGAYAVSVTFSNFNLKEGAKLFIWDQNKENFIGSFTNFNNKRWGSLATQLLHTDKIVVEVYEPKKTIGKNIYEIGQVVHAYRSILPKFESIKHDIGRGPFGNSGDCNININCPEGIDWQEDKTAVALIVSGSSAVCSGAMINNTSLDETPYFLTANHCLGGQNNWVFYFNHEATNCTSSTGPTNQSVSGSTLLASSGGSDFALLELSEPIPDSYDVCYAGWDNSDDQNVSATVCIHHPSGDVKKICFDDDPPYHQTQGGAQVWWIDQWELGVTEGGSSGSPLFDQNHRIIGQLYGGAAACSGATNNGQYDFYGRIGVSWDGSSSSNRLKDWLDPGNTGVTTLDAFCPNAVSYNNDGQIQNIMNVPDGICSSEPFSPSITIKNNGTNIMTSATISYIYNSGTPGTIPWTGSLAEDETDVIILPSFTPEVGTNTIEVEILNINGGVIDENSGNNSVFQELEYTVGEQILYVEILTDDYGYETYWEIRNGSGLVVLSGGNEMVGINGGGDEDATGGDPGAYDDNTLYSGSYVVPFDGCYEFEIVDDYADGICCDYGIGSYTVTDGLGNIIAEGGQFGSNEVVQTGMTASVSLNKFDDITINLYPNPANDELYIEFDRSIENVDIRLYDPLGKLVLIKNSVNSKRSVLDVSEFSNGLYTIAINSGSGSTSKRIVIQ